MDDIIERIREELKTSADEDTRNSGKRYFKESVRLHGVKTTLVTAIEKKYFHEVRALPKAEVFSLCERLWQSGYMEESFIASGWSYALQASFAPEDFPVFENWVARYVTNWASCDTLCNHTVGAFVEMYPQHLESLKRWARSENRWMRRAAAVSLIIPARHGLFLNDVLAIADILLLDKDDLVQKGYGWMLKAASESHQQEVFAYVMRNKGTMPRTALRYAIEKMPPATRLQAMEK
ncbi:MAG: DNA alkylation repair protein [Dehalococcoidia bacterium]|jgi:3-methyladenine DNA glycosylase AlkD|nr:DNA alkylation repair protein [Dehalococcoidia bacterium]